MRYKLVSFDMDGTLIRDTTADLFFATLLDVRQGVEKLEVGLRAGDIHYSDFMVNVAHVMKELSLDFIAANFERVPLVSGIAETVDALKKKGVAVMLITTSGQYFADLFRQRFNFDHAFGTKHHIDERGFVGVGIEVCSSATKVEHLRRIAAEHGLSLAECVAVGDSFSDIPVFKEAGLAIAFNYDESLEGLADVYVRSDDLTTVLKYII